MCDTCGCEEHGSVDTHAAIAPAGGARTIAIEERLLSANDAAAAHNRAHFARQGLLAVNLMGTPGAGKTALLEATIRAGRWRIAVIEGDQATDRDAARIAAAGAPVAQIETGAGCHLDAGQVHRALHGLGGDADVLFIENVGNLVCPALFDLGEHLRVVVTSPPEGEDKPLKYPPMFRAADVVVLNKVDLLPHLSFDLDAWRAALDAVNPRAAVVCLSARSGAGLSEWIEALAAARPRSPLFGSPPLGGGEDGPVRA
jgi:hydrogenase nickel incorporation protein HypB